MGALVLAGCSSAPSATHLSRSTTTTLAKGKPPPLATTTSASTTTSTAPPTEVAASVDIQISGSSAIVAFSSSSLTGSLAPSPGTFSQGGRVFTFTVSGVQYTGSPSTQTATGGLITEVQVSASSGGATVTVQLAASTSNAQFGIGRSQVGVTFS